MSETARNSVWNFPDAEESVCKHKQNEDGNRMKKDNVLLSVVVTIYNTAPYLKKCIESILKQTYTNLEILLIDDGSTDGSDKICDEYAGKDHRIKVCHKNNEGLVIARKTGVMLAEGGVITFVDSDDWIECEMYEKLIDEIGRAHV